MRKEAREKWLSNRWPDAHKKRDCLATGVVEGSGLDLIRFVKGSVVGNFKDGSSRVAGKYSERARTIIQLLDSRIQSPYSLNR